MSKLVDLVHCSHPAWPLRQGSRHLRIGVLDSSFNPPTKAHLALVNHSLEYEAKLLLLSVRNADKSLKPTDATYEQRSRMMVELVSDVKDDNVAVALIDEPGFVGKSRILQDFLKARIREQDIHPRLVFLLGFDTLERLFAPRYYGDSKETMYSALLQFFSVDQSRVVCASRSGSSETDVMTEIHEFLAKQSLPSDCVSLIDIGEEASRMSSTAVRDSIAKGTDEWKAQVSANIERFVIHEKLYH
ncbi:Nucleotidylyl transferase [Mycena floridula]|nr:Nucleotidylyl transferase [Mycena floridula]